MAEKKLRPDAKIVITIRRKEAGDSIEIYSEGLLFPEVIGTLEIAKTQIINYELGKADMQGGKLGDIKIVDDK